MNRELERYLHAASRGLWGKKRLEVREELRTHILERSRKHQIAGSSLEEAISIALTELGHPYRIGLEIARQRLTRQSLPLLLTVVSVFVVGQPQQFIASIPSPSSSTKLLGATLVTHSPRHAEHGSSPTDSARARSHHQDSTDSTGSRIVQERTTMTQLEHYLNQATRGLHGKKRLEVREELTNHILEKARGFEVVDCSPELALSKAIASLGKASSLRNALWGVHLLPKTLHASVALATAITGLFFLIAQPVIAQVQFTISGPTRPCQKCPGGRIPDSDLKQVWFNLESLARAFKDAGARVTQSKGVWRIGIDAKTLELTSSFRQDETDFIASWRLQRALDRTGLPVIARGWNSGELMVGSFRISISPQPGIVPLLSLYVVAFSDYAFKDLKAPSVSLPSPQQLRRFPRHRLRVSKPPNTIVALFTRGSDGLPRMDIAPVAVDGTVTLRAEHDRLRFGLNDDALSPYASQGRYSAQLVALTGRLDSQAATAGKVYEVINPASLESDALK